MAITDQELADLQASIRVLQEQVTILSENEEQVALLQEQLDTLQSNLRRYLESSDALAPQLYLSAWDNASPRAQVGVGKALVEETGITFAKVANTQFLSVEALAISEIYLGSSLTGAPIVA